MKMPKITIVLFLTVVSILGMSFGTVVIFPKGKIVIDQENVQVNHRDTLVPVEPTEEYQDTVSIDEDNLPLGVPSMGQGEVDSIVCNDDEELNSYSINYSGLSDDALEQYKAILEAAGYDTDAIKETEEGAMLSAQDGFVSLVVFYNDSAATINADLM